MCYCHCDHAAGAKQCTKMCELPQYENRWWATSCHKKSSSAEAAAPHNSNSHSKKTNRTEQARSRVAFQLPLVPKLTFLQRSSKCRCNTPVRDPGAPISRLASVKTRQSGDWRSRTKPATIFIGTGDIVRRHCISTENRGGFWAKMLRQPLALGKIVFVQANRGTSQFASGAIAIRRIHCRKLEQASRQTVRPCVTCGLARRFARFIGNHCPIFYFQRSSFTGNSMIPIACSSAVCCPSRPEDALKIAAYCRRARITRPRLPVADCSL